MLRATGTFVGRSMGTFVKGDSGIMSDVSVNICRAIVGTFVRFDSEHLSTLAPLTIYRKKKTIISRNSAKKTPQRKWR